MKHDISKFGERVRNRRKELGLTQMELGLKIWPEPINENNDNSTEKNRESARKKINQYEKKNIAPGSIDDLCKLCDELDCSMDYLLGAITLPQKELTDIHDATGLSEKAIIRIMHWNDPDSIDSLYGRFIDALNRIIESASIEHLLDSCIDYRDFCRFMERNPELLTRYFLEAKRDEYNKAMETYGSTEDAKIKSFIHLEMFSIAQKGLAKSIIERATQEFETVLKQIGESSILEESVTDGNG